MYNCISIIGIFSSCTMAEVFEGTASICSTNFELFGPFLTTFDYSYSMPTA